MADSSTQRGLKEFALAVPRLAKLIGRLLRDPRVPARVKVTLMVSGGYLIFPLDIVPDFLPLGQVDDLIVVCFALDQILNHVDEKVVREHWDGEDDVLDLIRELTQLGARLMPRPVRSLLDRALHR